MPSTSGYKIQRYLQFSLRFPLFSIRPYLNLGIDTAISNAQVDGVDGVSVGYNSTGTDDSCQWFVTFTDIPGNVDQVLLIRPTNRPPRLRFTAGAGVTQRDCLGEAAHSKRCSLFNDVYNFQRRVDGYESWQSSCRRTFSIEGGKLYFWDITPSRCLTQVTPKYPMSHSRARSSPLAFSSGHVLIRVQQKRSQKTY